MHRAVICALVLIGAASPARAETKWTTVRTSALTVIGDQPASVLRKVATEMEQFRAVVGELFPAAERPLPLPTMVFVFGERKSAAPFMPLGPGRKPAQLAGYFHSDQDMNNIVMTLEGFDEAGPIVYHEYTHLLVRNAVRSVPVWLNEGLAEYYSTYTLTGGGKVAEIGRPIARHVQLLREKYTPLAELIAVDRTSDLYNESQRRSIFYAQSWALVHYLMAEMKDGPNAINRYAAAIGAGVAPAEAFRSAFGAAPADLDQALRAYVRRMTFAAQRFTFDEKVAAPDLSNPRTMTGGEADAWLGDLQRRIGRQDEGARRVEAAVRLDPSAPASHLAAGLLRLSQGRDNEGLDALKRAAELGRDDFTMPFMHGLWLLRTGYRDRVSTAPAAIPAMKRAVELKPDSADAFGWLAFAQMQQAATIADARTSIDRALELAPGVAAFRIRRAEIVARQGQYEEARETLKQMSLADSDPLASDAAGAALDSLARALEHTASNGDVIGHVGLPGTERLLDDDGRVAPDLRKPRDGEVRDWGWLVRVDCDPSGVRFEVRGGARTVVASARRMDDVELISYLSDRDFTIACGRRTRPDLVFLTWTPGESASDTRDGVAVAVEFLPRGFTP